MNRVMIRLSVATAAMIALAGCSGGVTESAIGPTATTPEWLFVVQATDVSTVDSATGTVTMPADVVEAFTDRPVRESRTMEPSEFADLWTSQASDSFAVDPPNAVLTYWTATDLTSTPHTLTCEVVDAVSYAADTGSLRLSLRPIDGSALALPERLLNASLFIDDTPICTNSADDEMIVEYVNEMNFQDAFGVATGTDPQSGAYTVTPTCPERESSTIPPGDMDVRISTPDGSEYGSCHDGIPLTITQADLPELSSCSADGRCTFTISVLNTVTKEIYTQTTVSVQVTSPLTMQVDLNPATIPLCPDGQ